MVCIHIVINRIWSGSADHLDVLDLTNCYAFTVCNIWPLRLGETLGAALEPRAKKTAVRVCVYTRENFLPISSFSLTVLYGE